MFHRIIAHMHYDTLASKETVQKTMKALQEKGFSSLLIKDKGEALQKLQSLIAEGASVMNGSSRTLEEIGFMDYLKTGEHPWNNLHEQILSEKDPEKQGRLRRTSVVSDYYVGSVHAVTEEGELVFASNSGSQLPHLAFTSPNVLLVVSTKKIVPDLASAFVRIDEFILPQEEQNMQKKYGMGTNHTKTLILHKENPMWGRTVTVLFVEEKLGF